MSYFKSFIPAIEASISFFSGIRVKTINDKSCQTTVSLSWINQNPLSLCFGPFSEMAAELSTGLLIMNKIKNSGYNISMLVLHNKTSFYKKEKGNYNLVAIRAVK